MASRLRIGIIGLGRRWRRWRPALHELRGRVAVRAACDQRSIRAERAARELGCAAEAGPTDLLDRDDVKAVLLLDPQWFGLWPVGRAARLGKPVLCAVSPACDDAHADDVMRRVREAGLPVMAPAALALSPAATRLREWLAARPGGARLVRCDWCGRGATPADLPGARVLPSLMQTCARPDRRRADGGLGDRGAGGTVRVGVAGVRRRKSGAAKPVDGERRSPGVPLPGRNGERRRGGGLAADAALARRRGIARRPGGAPFHAAAAAGAVSRRAGRGEGTGSGTRRCVSRSAMGARGAAELGGRAARRNLGRGTRKQPRTR